MQFNTILDNLEKAGFAWSANENDKFINVYLNKFCKIKISENKDLHQIDIVLYEDNYITLWSNRNRTTINILKNLSRFLHSQEWNVSSWFEKVGQKYNQSKFIERGWNGLNKKNQND